MRHSLTSVNVTFVFLIALSPALAQNSQTAPPNVSSTQSQPAAAPVPQTPRQALIEIITAKDTATFEKHLPDALKARLKQLAPELLSSNGVSVNGGWLQGFQAAGMKPEIEPAGPVLLRLEDPRTHQKTEVTFDDDLAGDEDDIALGFHVYKEGEEEAHWFDPKITLRMQQEQSIWKIMEIGFSARLPIGNPDFLDAMVKSFQKEHQQMGEMFDRVAVEQINRSEAQYLNKYGTYACSLDVLGKALQVRMQNNQGYDPVKSELEQAQSYGYALKLSACSGAGYTLTAAPTSGSGKAFCSDEGGKLRYSDDGKAESCVSNGVPLSDSQPAMHGVIVPSQH